MNVFQSTYDLLFRDMVRVYRLLNGKIRASIWWLFFCMLVAAGLECIAVTALAYLGMSIAAPQAIARHPLFSKILTFFPSLSPGNAGPQDVVFVVALLCLLVFAFKNAFQAYVAWHSAVMGERISFYLGTQILHRFLYSSYMWHISADSGKTLQALTGKDYISTLVVQLIFTYTYVMTAMALLVTLLSATPKVIFITIAGTMFAAIVVYRALKDRIDNAAIVVNDMQQNLQRTMMNILNGIREVLIYRQQSEFVEVYKRICSNSAPNRCFLAMAPPIPTWILETVGISIIPLSVWILAIQGGADMATIATTLSLILLTSWRILPMVNRALSSLISVRSVRPAAVVCISTLETLASQPSRELPPPDPNFTLDKGIELKDVSFRYPSNKNEVIHGLSLRLDVGKQYGLVGLSGAGKSTIVGILSGLLEASGGDMLVDGQPLDLPRLAAYMPQIGYVPQSPYILPGTVAENVAFSEWGKPIDEERVLLACRQASLDIINQGRGIHTGVGGGGSGMSGGQAQRVSLARALYCNPRVLILDEATSSLDQANEKSIMEAISEFRHRTITVIVAHRLSTVENCDHIFWLVGGKLYLEGRPEDVLPKYREFMRNQL